MKGRPPLWLELEDRAQAAATFAEATRLASDSDRLLARSRMMRPWRVPLLRN